MNTKGIRESVNRYINEYRSAARNELSFFEMQPSLERAVELAALAKTSNGRRHRHQARIPEPSLVEAAKRLLKLLAQIQGCENFDELLKLVEREIDPIWKIGKLAVYDVSLRIGAYLGLEPDRVYLHAGTRVGAKILGLNYKQESLSLGELPKEFQKLSPGEIEDCLCIFANDFSSSTCGTSVFRLPEQNGRARVC